MNFPKIDHKTRNYLLIALISLILWQFSVFIRTLPVLNIYLISRFFDIFPNFILCIGAPFALIGLMRLFFRVKNETRIFYYSIYFLMFLAALIEFIAAKYYGFDFDVFKIIASCIAFFIDMILQNSYEIKIMKQNRAGA